MHPAGHLYRLQETDLGLAAVDERLVEIAEALGETEELRSAQEALNSAEDSMRQWQTTLRTREMEVRTASSKIRESEAQLYSGRVRNPKELKGLEEELQSLRRRRSALEDSQLEAMLQVERYESVLLEKKESLARISSEWSTTQQELTREQAECQERRSELLKRRRELAAAAAQHMPIYEDLRRRRAGRPVARLRDGVCDACGMALPTGKVQQVKYSKTLEHCPSCGRVLWAG